MKRFSSQCFVLFGATLVIAAALCGCAKHSHDHSPAMVSQTGVSTDSEAVAANQRSHDHHAHSHTHDHAHAADHDHPHDHSHDGSGAMFSYQHPRFEPDASCQCAAAIMQHGWCSRCNAGYVGGQRINSAMLFETLDAHGHDLNLAGITCAQCQQAIQQDGFCTTCGMGFLRRQAYFTQLTHSLAKGRVVKAAEVSCSSCKAALGKVAWCDACQRGIVGNVMLSDRSAFEVAAREYRILQAAIDKTATCEVCACAMVVHRSCPQCLISYAPNAGVDSSGSQSR